MKYSCVLVAFPPKISIIDRPINEIESGISNQPGQGRRPCERSISRSTASVDDGKRERDQDPAFKSFRLTSVSRVLLHPDGRGRSCPVQICLLLRRVSTFPGDLRDRILGPIDSFNAARKTARVLKHVQLPSSCNQTRHILHVHVVAAAAESAMYFPPSETVASRRERVKQIIAGLAIALARLVKSR